ncbi:hypothetical protein C2G38_2058695 [Gigaspora rosea]|uniref:Jacalin-type lectin domain-containing protein n=1 Tax=Gigaspora rosea TaxID=44941 RepID=A0A397W3R2_9GLOM|nr:hypothetical protein C2G38_2058695 [Gigaspora rosea]
MTIIVKTVSNTYGGVGGSSGNDFGIIYQIIDGESIKSINVKRIKVQTNSTDSYLLSLQFIYNVETNDGEKLVTGALRGRRTGILQTYDLNNNEKVKAIAGTYGSYAGYIVVKYFEFQTSVGTRSYGKNDSGYFIHIACWNSLWYEWRINRFSWNICSRRSSNKFIIDNFKFIIGYYINFIYNSFLLY